MNNKIQSFVTFNAINQSHSTINESYQLFDMYSQGTVNCFENGKAQSVFTEVENAIKPLIKDFFDKPYGQIIEFDYDDITQCKIFDSCSDIAILEKSHLQTLAKISALIDKPQKLKLSTYIIRNITIDFGEKELSLMFDIIAPIDTMTY